MNVEDEEADSLAKRMVDASQTNDFSTFAEICGCLLKEDERKRVAESLLRLAGAKDFQQVEQVVDSLMFSGLAWEGDCSDRLLQLAENIFTQDAVLTLSQEEEHRMTKKGVCSRMSPKLRLLRSMIYVAVRGGGQRGLLFVASIERAAVMSPIASKIVQWKSE